MWADRQRASENGRGESKERAKREKVHEPNRVERPKETSSLRGRVGGKAHDGGKL